MFAKKMKSDLEGFELNFNWIIYDLSGIIQLFEFIRTQRSIGFKTFSTIFSLYTQQNLVNLVEFAIEFNLIAISSRNIKGLRHQAVIIQWLEISVRGKLSICSFIIYISPQKLPSAWIFMSLNVAQHSPQFQNFSSP